MQPFTNLPSRVIDRLKVLINTPLYNGKSVLVLGYPSDGSILEDDLEHYYTIRNFEYADTNVTLSEDSFKEIDNLLHRLERKGELYAQMNQNSILTIDIIKKYKEHLKKKYIEENEDIDFTRQVDHSDEVVLESLSKLNPDLLKTINLTLIANAKQIEKLKELIYALDSILFGIFKIGKTSQKIYLLEKELDLEVNQHPWKLLFRFISNNHLLQIKEIHEMFNKNTKYTGQQSQRNAVNDRIDYLRDHFAKVSNKHMRKLLVWRPKQEVYELLPEL